ncbi:MAG: siderophore-interacting protein [Actinomycetota bacterium]
MYAEVQSVQRLSPSMVRVVLGGGEIAGFTASDATDAYVNAAFIPEGAPYGVPFDPEAVKDLDVAHRPRQRRYTVRSWDDDRQLLTIDFVAHGDEGYAGPWAQAAQPGDRLQFKGPGGSYAPNVDADWHLMVGDESALPAIGASLEKLAPGARAVAVLVVDGPEDELALTSPGDLEVHWLHRKTSEDPESLLPTTVAALPWAEGTVDVFVHGEAGEVRAVRKILIGERGVDPSSASISPYWRRNFTDEKWREIKAAWVAEQANDV